MRITYTPAINSISQLIDSTKELLASNGLEEGVDFLVPSESWVKLQLSPSHENQCTAERYTGKLPFKCKLISRSGHDDSHPHGQYCAVLKRNWRYGAFMKRSALKEAQTDPVCAETVLSPTNGQLLGGQDDKTCVPVGSKVPIQATANQSARAIVQEGTVVQAADHSWLMYKLIPSVSSRFNIRDTFGESLFSGGAEGHGHITVALHDAIFEPSTSFHHAASFYKLIVDNTASTRAPESIVTEEHAEEGQGLASSMPYYVLIECDGGPDHNITFLSNQIAAFALFLVGNMDKLDILRCCPGLSFLCTTERAMSILNLGLSNLSLMISPDSPEFLLKDVLARASSMKAVRSAVAQYDQELPLALDALERKLKAMVETEADNESTEHRSGTSQEAGQPEGEDDDAEQIQVGHEVNKLFKGNGWFKGRVDCINQGAAHGKIYRIIFEDGDEEDWSPTDLEGYAEEARIEIGDLGF